MKLSRVIPPEIFLGTRGHPAVIQFYKKAFSEFTIVPGERPTIEASKDLVDMLGENSFRHMVLARHFREVSGKTYYLTNDFTQALANLDRKIPIEYLPDQFIGYFVFGDGTAIQDESQNVEGGLVYIGSSDTLALVGEDKKALGTRALIINYFNTAPAEGTIGSIFRIAYSLDELASKKVEEFIEERVQTMRDEYINGNGIRQAPVHKDVAKKRAKVLRALINATLYASSDEPEVCRLQPISQYSNKKRKEMMLTLPAENGCTVPITLLNYAYKHGVQHTMDSTVVQTHMRWQRCGEAYSKIKLVWVKEHERHFIQQQLGRTNTPDLAHSVGQN